MSHRNISPEAQALLTQLSVAMLGQPALPCHALEHRIESLTPPMATQMRICMQGLLLDQMQNHLLAEQSPPLQVTTMLGLFDHYLSCMSDYITQVLTEPHHARIATEALRELAFDLMQQMQTSRLRDTAGMDRKRSRHSDRIFDQVMPQDVFIAACNQLRQHPETRNFVILGVQFDFGMHSNNHVQPLLPEIAAILNQLARPGDFIAHISTRRWAICLQQADQLPTVVRFVEKLQAAFRTPLALDDRQLLIRPYIGIALSRSIGRDADFLLQAALKVSNMPENHPDRYRVYDPELDAESKRLDRLSIELQKAIQNEALELYYQPKFSLRQNKIVGLEALLRWQAGEDLVPNALIFRLIERDGMLASFTRWLLQTAFRQLIEFINKGMDIVLSVNIQPQNLNEPDFPGMLASLLDTWEVPRERLIIEITEGSLVQDAEDTIEALNRIRGMGLKISIDDFGTGYSSLSYLSRLPINEIKIDQAFIRNIFSSDRDEAIVRTIIELGRNFHLDFVAEGIEDEATATKLASMGCDILQGYWFCKAMTHDELLAWFHNDEKQVWKRISP